MDDFRALLRRAEAGAFRAPRSGHLPTHPLPPAARPVGALVGAPSSPASTPSPPPELAAASREPAPPPLPPSPPAAQLPHALSPDSLSPLSAWRALVASASSSRAPYPPHRSGPPARASSPFAAMLASAPPLRVQLLDCGSPPRPISPAAPSSPRVVELELPPAPRPVSSAPTFVPYKEYRAALTAATGALDPSEPGASLSGDDTDDGDLDALDDAECTSLPAMALPPLSSAPLDRERAARVAAARALVDTGLLPSSAMRSVFSEDPATPSDPGLVADYVEHLAAWSAGWLGQVRSTVVELATFLAGRRTPQGATPTDPPSTTLSVPLTAREFEAFLRVKDSGGASCRASAETRIRWLAARAGFTWFSVFTVAAAAQRRHSRATRRREATPAPPLDLDELAHLALVVADTRLPALARSVAASFHYAVNACHRFITAQRCGELSSPAGSLFICGVVAADYKKSRGKVYDKPSLGLRTTVFGDDLFPLLLDGLQGVLDRGFLFRDFSSRRANPFEAGVTWLDAPMSAKRLERCLGHLLCSYAMYPDGQPRRPKETPTRLARLSGHSLRHVLPAVGGATHEPPAAINEVGIWSRSTAESTSASTLGRLAQQASSHATAGAPPASAFRTAMQYASHGTQCSLPETLLRLHSAIFGVLSEAGPTYATVAGDAGWTALSRHSASARSNVTPAPGPTSLLSGAHAPALALPRPGPTAAAPAQALAVTERPRVRPTPEQPTEVPPPKQPRCSGATGSPGVTPSASAPDTSTPGPTGPDTVGLTGAGTPDPSTILVFCSPPPGATPCGPAIPVASPVGSWSLSPPGDLPLLLPSGVAPATLSATSLADIGNGWVTVPYPSESRDRPAP